MSEGMIAGVTFVAEAEVTRPEPDATPEKESEK